LFLRWKLQLPRTPATNFGGLGQLPKHWASKENLAALRELAESGKLTPAIDRTYPLSDVPEAIWYVEVEHARAKVIITV
jgi:NADPH:quinone reductase-like Zn-dependent oxidoreductase